MDEFCLLYVGAVVAKLDFKSFFPVRPRESRPPELLDPTTVFRYFPRLTFKSDAGVRLLVRRDGEVALRVDGEPPPENISFRFEAREDFFSDAEVGELLPRTLWKPL